MTSVPMLEDEPGRLAALQRLEILDTEAEEPFEHIVSLVRSVLNVPIAAVSLVDSDRQWFKARAGLEARETPRDLSFCSHAIKETQPFLIEDALDDDRFAGNALVIGDPKIRSYAGVPLRTPEGYNVGALCAIDQQPRHFTETEVTMLKNLARIVETELELRRIAERDVLTSALTRRAFAERALVEIDRFHRYSRPSTLVLADLDHFKAVNDTYGHAAGDCVLREVARLVTDLKRDADVMGRLGGEEFAVLLPETNVDAAHVAVERFRKKLEDHPISLPGDQVVKVTASFGIAEMEPAISSVEEWLAAADKPLYAAKRLGRNRSEIASGTFPQPPMLPIKKPISAKAGLRELCERKPERRDR